MTIRRRKTATENTLDLFILIQTLYKLARNDDAWQRMNFFLESSHRDYRMCKRHSNSARNNEINHEIQGSKSLTETYLYKGVLPNQVYWFVTILYMEEVWKKEEPWPALGKNTEELIQRTYHTRYLYLIIFHTFFDLEYWNASEQSH